MARKKAMESELRSDFTYQLNRIKRNLSGIDSQIRHLVPREEKLQTLPPPSYKYLEIVNTASEIREEPTMIVTLPSLIRFRYLAGQLCTAEFNEFVIKLVADCGRDIFMTSIFHALCAGIFDMAVLKNTCSIMSDIITNRKSAEENDEKWTTKALHCLPVTLIAEVR